MSKLRVLLADDHGVVREGLKTMINAQPDMTVCGEAADGLAAAELAARTPFDVAVVDIAMPGLNGAELTAQLRTTCPGAKVLALTVHEDRTYMRVLFAAGVAGYVLKRAAAFDLIQAVRAVAAGGTYVDPLMAVNVASKFARGTHEGASAQELSEREAEVVKAIAQGYSNKEIAGRLGLSVKTVETYKSRSLEKLGVYSRVDLVRYASLRGWLAVSDPLPVRT